MISIGGILAKRCSSCEVTKELERFYAGRKYRDGIRSTCAECDSKRVRRRAA